MNLDEELTATLGQEAETRSVPLPDVAGLIRRGRVRRRRRNVARIVVAAAAATLLGGAAYGIAQLYPAGPGTASPPIPPSFQDLNGNAIESGTYRTLVGADPTGAKIEADMIVTGPNWAFSGQPVVFEGGAWAGVGVYQPDTLAGAAPCTGDWQGRDADETPQAMARQLVELPRSTVVQPLTPTEAFGHEAIHLRLRIDDPCRPPGYYQIAEGPAGSRGISYGTAFTAVLIDFWVVDLDGTAVVVDLWHHGDASTELVARVTQVRDSITFVTDE